jgi:DNA-directed RNA polymerase subunit RPC12/RpoP
MEYKLKDKTNKDCPKCNSKLYNEIINKLLDNNHSGCELNKADFVKWIKETDYLYVCLDCDENFYNFETEKELCKN